MTPPQQPIPLDELAVKTLDLIPDADFSPYFDEYINAELMLAKRRGRDGSLKSG